MDARVIYGIRDAQKLTTNEKVFLYTVASHNDGMFATHDKNYTAMGISKATYYRVRDALIKKELVTVQRVMDGPTVYKVNKDVLDGWNKSLSETSQSHSETKESHTETNESHCAETKVNIKGNKKVNFKENTNAVADAPSFDNQENKNNKDDQHEAILIGSNELEPSLIGSKTSSPIALPTTGGGAGGAVDRWKQKNGIKTIEWELPEWSKPGWEPPVKKKVTVPAYELDWS